MKKQKSFLLIMLSLLCLAALFAFPAAADKENSEVVLENPISYKGMSTRLRKDKPGLRSLYAVDLAMVEAWEEAGYTVEYGAVMAVATVNGVTRTCENIGVVRKADGYKSTLSNSTAVCVYSSDANASYDTRRFVSYDEESMEATFSYTGLFSPKMDQSYFYEMGFIYTGFFYAEKDGESCLLYAAPEVETCRFFEDGEATLYEIAEYWSTRIAAAAKNPNIVKVVRSRLATEMTTSETVTATKSQPAVFHLTNMKAGIYSFTIAGNASAKSYAIVDTNGDVARQRLAAGNFDQTFVHLYLKDGDNTVTLIPESGTFTLTSVKIALVEELLPEDTRLYSINLDRVDGVLDDASGAINSTGVQNPLTGKNVYYYAGSSGTKSMQVRFKELSADRYRVGIIYTASTVQTVKCGTSAENYEITTSVPLSEKMDGSTGGGASFTWLGSLTLGEGDATLCFSTPGSFVNIMDVILIRDAHNVDFYDVTGKLVSQQRVYHGESAVLPSFDTPKGYVRPAEQTLALDNITADTSFTLHTWRESLTASAANGTLTATDVAAENGSLTVTGGAGATATLTGATAGYYEVSLGTAVTSAVNYLNVKNSSQAALFRTRLKAGDKDAVCTVWLDDGTNTLTLYTSGESITYSDVTFRNVTDAYKATRIAASSHDESRGSWTSGGGKANENLMFRAGSMAAFTGVTVPMSGEYYLAAAGNANDAPVRLTFSEADASGTGTLVPTETLAEFTVPMAKHNTSTSNVTLDIPTNTFYLEAGEHAFTLASTGYFYLDAIVLVPHEYHTFDSVETVQATCISAGYTRAVCSVCGESDSESYEEIPAVGHAYAYVETAAATCTETGLREEICMTCGDVTGNKETLPLKEHSYTYVETIAPTCIEEGLLTEVCSRCGAESGETAPAPLADHSYAAVTVAPTCTSLGYVRNICSVCSAEGEILSETPMLAHTYEYYLTAEATCITEGEMIELCSVCHTPSGNKTVLPTTDVHVGEWVILTEPTATRQGYAAEKCIYCDGTLANTKLERSIGTSRVSALTAENLVIAEDGKSATFTLTAEVAGFYEVRIEGHGATGKYFNLYNKSFDETLHSVQKDTDGSVGCDTHGFAVYLKEGANEIRYSVNTATAVSIDGATAQLLSEQTVSAYVETVKTYIPSYATGDHVFGSFTIETGGFYRVSAFLSSYQSTLSFTLTDSTGKEYCLDADVSSILLPALGSSNSAGFDAFGIIYLPEETYELTLNVKTSEKLQIGSVFFSCIPEAEGAYYLYVDPMATPGVGTGAKDDPYVLNTIAAAYEKTVSLINDEKRADIIIGLSGGQHKLTSELLMDGSQIFADDYSITFNGVASDKEMSSVFEASNISELPTLISSTVDIGGADFTAVSGTNYYSYKLPDSAKYLDENGVLVYPKFRDLYVNGVSLTPATSQPMDRGLAGVDDYRIYKDTAKSAAAAGLPEDARLLYLHPSMLCDVALDADGNVIGSLEIWIRTEWQIQMVHIEHIDKNPAVSITATAEYSPLGAEETLWACRVPEKEWDVFADAYFGSLQECVYYASNNISLLDEAGEFFYDRENGTVYFYPDREIEGLTVSYPLAERLFYMKNMQNLVFNNVNMYGVTVNFVTENGYFSGQGGRLKNLDENGNPINTFLPYGAVYGVNVSNLAFYHCNISNVGCDAINLRGAVDNVTVEDCVFERIGGSAFRSGIGGHALNTEKQHNTDITVTQCYINMTGMAYNSYTGILVTSVENLTLSHNTILNSSYSAISIGWNWASYEVSGVSSVNVINAVVSHNYINNFMINMLDGGAIYVLGGNAAYTDEEYKNSMNNNVVVATEATGNGISRWTVFYHDSGTSHWHDYDNVLVMDPKVMKLRNGYVSYSMAAPSYSNLTERLYVIGYQDDRRYDASGNYLDTQYVFNVDANGNTSPVTGAVSAGFLFMSSNGKYLTNNTELLEQYVAYINPDGSYTMSPLACLDDTDDYIKMDESGNVVYDDEGNIVYDFTGCDCPLILNGLPHDHHNVLRNCYKYKNFAAAEGSAQYDAISAIIDGAGCDTAKPDADTLAAYFNNMEIHCPCCWGTDVTYEDGKGYRCYTCQPKGSGELFGTVWYFSEFN